MTRNERIVSVLILTGLLGIAAGVAAYRLSYRGSSSSLLSLLPEPPGPAWRRWRQPEQYPAYRLYEKINGADMEYLDRGCLGLAWNAYVNTANEKFSIDLFIYDMAQASNARSIYESVRGPPVAQMQAVDIGDEAYMILGSLFFRSGRYYVKLQASADEQAVSSACKTMARQIAAKMESAVR